MKHRAGELLTVLIILSMVIKSVLLTWIFELQWQFVVIDTLLSLICVLLSLYFTAHIVDGK